MKNNSFGRIRLTSMRFILLASIHTACTEAPNTLLLPERESDESDEATSDNDSGTSVGPKPRPPRPGSTTDDGGDDDSTESGETEFERPELHSPAEAEDMAPEADIVRVELTAAEHTYEVDGQLIDGYAYNRQVPGPTIRLKQGDTLIVDFQNDLEVPTTIHWHGLHVPFEMDGVTWQGAPIAAGDSFQYRFTVNQSGTYWYHPHFDTERQLDLGLYGVIIVEGPEEPEVDREVVAVFDAWGEQERDSSQDNAHHGLDGIELNWAINGLRDPIFKAKSGEVLRLRAVNVSNAGYIDLRWRNMRLIASDQGFLPAINMADRVTLTNGDRTEAELLLGKENVDLFLHPISINGGSSSGDEERVLTVETDGDNEPPLPLAWPHDPRAVSKDPPYTDIHYTFHGDPHTGEWLINGERFPDITIEELPINNNAIIELRNLSPAAHPFHLHGHGFEVLSINHQPVEHFTFEDNFNVGIRETVRIKLYANNPGDWMTHCHILPHVEGGMMTVLRVSED